MRCYRSNFMAGVALAVLLCTPALAKEAVGSLSLSDNFRTQAEAVQTSISGGDMTSAAAHIPGLRAAAQTGDEKYAAGELGLQVASARNDGVSARKAIGDILDSGVAPKSRIPELRYMAGYFSYYNGDFNDAIKQLTQARSEGINTSQSALLLGDAYIRRNRAAEGLPLIKQTLDGLKSGEKPITEAFYDRAASTAYAAKDWPAVATFYQDKLAVYPSAENWRTALINYMAQPAIPADAQLDLYRLMAATGALASERDSEAYAKLAADEGYNAEAKTVIEAGQKNGDLMNSNPVTSRILRTATPRAKTELAGLPDRAKRAQSSSTAAAAVGAADGYFSAGQYPEAVPLYRLALTKSGVDMDKVNTRLGIALARSGDLAGGKAILDKVTTGEWGRVARFWSVWTGQQITRTATAPKLVPTAG